MRVYGANQVADFFLARSNPEFGDLLSNLKLQKLCYYAAGIIAAVRNNDDCPLFNDSIEAWQHGPVVPTQYHRFSEFRAENIPPLESFDFGQFEERDQSVLDDVYNFYGQYSAWKLRNMTHEERPWIEAYDRVDKTISAAELRNYFSQEITDEYIESYHA
ncbi:Panacea domain-containing protein [Roseibium sp.]|uniref:Panacea domain-containing protein n=1 Tax=Roseibium sp. TaxID=1936156 RepID=UPI003D0AEEAB